MNKYAVLSILLFLLQPVCSWGQRLERGKREIGVQAGPSYTYLRGNEKADQCQGDLRGAAGVYFRCQLSKVSLRAEVLYETKGDREVGSSRQYDLQGNQTGEASYTLRKNFQYLTLPVLVEVPVIKRALFLSFGPYLGYLLEQELSAYEEDLDFTALYHRLDAGVTGGVTYYRPLSTSFSLKTELRHSLGLNNVSKDTQELGIIKTNSTKLLIGISYSL